MLGNLGELVGEGGGDPIILGSNGLRVGLVVDRVQQRAHPRPRDLRGDRHQVGRVVGSAALPGRPGQAGAHGGQQPGVGIGGNQFDPGQPAGGQRPQEREPAGAVFGGGDVDAQDFAIALGVDPDRDQRVHVDHPTLLADLETRASAATNVYGPPSSGRLRNASTAVSSSLAITDDLRLRQAGDPQGPHELVHPPRRNPQQVAGGHHRGQCPLGAFAAFQQPVREVGAVPQLGDRQIQRPCAGVELAMPITVALVRPLGAALAVPGTAQRVGLRAQQGVDERRQQFAQHVGVGGGESIGQHRRPVDIVGSGHRVNSFARVTLTGLSKNHAMTFIYSATTRRTSRSGPARTPPWWTQGQVQDVVYDVVV